MSGSSGSSDRLERQSYVILEIIALIGHSIMGTLGVFSFAFNVLRRNYVISVIAALFIGFNSLSACNHLRSIRSAIKGRAPQ